MFKDKLRLIDLKAIVLFAFAYPMAALKRVKHKDVWLLSERKDEARDNGYWMYKYIKDSHPEQEAYYVIEQKSKDREKLIEFGNIIDFGSFRHYIYYLLAKKHISAHVDADSPNSRVSNFLETHHLLHNKRIFLQHGITKDRISFGYYSVSRADLFVCAAKPEYEFCKKEFGYPDGAVKLLGFARFDGLGIIEPKRQILIMPTWRAWLANADEEHFIESNYFIAYQRLLNNRCLIQLLLDNDVRLVFFPHSEMQKYISCFKIQSNYIRIATMKTDDMQNLLNNSLFLITDYSSVAFDMAYMERPVIYYQFDYDEYRTGQHPEGYFQYKRDGFGPVCNEEDEVIDRIESLLINKSIDNGLYIERSHEFFKYYDNNNSYRIYESIKKL